jgi:uncharacterized protein DUF2382
LGTGASKEHIQVRMLTDLAEELVRQELAGEHLEVGRIPIDLLIEPGSDLPRIRTEGSVTIFPVLQEVVIVEKRLRLKEELRIIKRVTTETTEIPITVRKQRAIIERLNSEGVPITEVKE